MAGGRLYVHENLKEVRAFADKYKLPVIYDATRAAENAYFIQQRKRAIGQENQGYFP